MRCHWHRVHVEPSANVYVISAENCKNDHRSLSTHVSELSDMLAMLHTESSNPFAEEPMALPSIIGPHFEVEPLQSIANKSSMCVLHAQR